MDKLYRCFAKCKRSSPSFLCSKKVGLKYIYVVICSLYVVTRNQKYYSIVYAIDFPLAYSIIWVFVLFRFIDLDWNETVRKRKWQGKIKSTHDVKMEQWTEGSGRKRENTGFYVKTEQQCFPQHYNNRVLRPDWKIPKMGVHNYYACVKCN